MHITVFLDPIDKNTIIYCVEGLKMKVLIINGSPRIDGNTSIALNEMKKVFEKEGIEVEEVQIGQKTIRGCIACGFCHKNGRCVFDDEINEVNAKFEDADGLQTMRTLAHNMSFLIKSIALGKERYGLPEKEKPQRTNFIR